MRTDLDSFLDEGPPHGIAVERIKGLTLGAKMVLAGGLLLFFSLFLTWQNLEIDYGRTGTGTLRLDGWDSYGLLIGLLTLGLVSLVLFVKLSDAELLPDLPWELVTLAIAASLLGLVAVKSLTDRNSAWASYLALVLAGVMVAGAFLDWSSERSGRRAVPRRRRRVRTSA
jgi:hypothetical protein